MEVKSISPNFGAHVKTAQATKYLNRLPYDKAIQAVVMEMDSKHNKVDVFVSTFMKNGKEKLQAEVGHKTFKEGCFKGPIKVLRTATDFANKLGEKLETERQLTEGMTRPKMD